MHSNLNMYNHLINICRGPPGPQPSSVQSLDNIQAAYKNDSRAFFWPHLCVWLLAMSCPFYAYTSHICQPISTYTSLAYCIYGFSLAVRTDCRDCIWTMALGVASAFVGGGSARFHMYNCDIYETVSVERQIGHVADRVGMIIISLLMAVSVIERIADKQTRISSNIITKCNRAICIACCSYGVTRDQGIPMALFVFGMGTLSFGGLVWLAPQKQSRLSLLFEVPVFIFACTAHLFSDNIHRISEASAEEVDVIHAVWHILSARYLYNMCGRICSNHNLGYNWGDAFMSLTCSVTGVVCLLLVDAPRLGRIVYGISATVLLADFAQARLYISRCATSEWQYNRILTNNILPMESIS